MTEEKKISFPKPFQKFLLRHRQLEAVEEVQNSYAQYDIAPNTFTTSLSQMRAVNDMLLDPVINSAVSLVMETAFQMNDEQRLFELTSEFKAIKTELDAFHEDLDIDNQLLTWGYNTLVWGNLPIKKNYDKQKRLIGVTPIGDFTSVTPIILSGITAGYTVDGEYHFPFEYYYLQAQHYKNLGGPYSNVSSYITKGENRVLNEFVYAPSYLTSAAKAWRNVNIIEDALLLARMDQSNYYRIISVDVNGPITSKNAIQALNFYRNVFKKVRRVSYDPSGMSSRGTNQEFEVIVPKNSNQGVSVENVGGDLDIKALKDLDTQYSRLFAALRVNPSQIGFNSDTPGTLNGEGPGLLWDERFARTCKAYVHAVFGALRDIDYTFLRSRGYSVKKNDWHYNVPATSLLADHDRNELLSDAVDTLQKLTQQFRDNEVDFDKKYLFNSILGSSLSLTGIDMNRLLNPKDAEEKQEPQMLGSSAYAESDPLDECQRRVLVQAELLDEKEKPTLIASHSGTVPLKDLLFKNGIFPMELAVDTSQYVLSSKLPKLETSEMKKDTFVTIPLPDSVCVSSRVKLDFTVEDITEAGIGCIDNAILYKNQVILSSREDVLHYIALLQFGNKNCVVSNLYHYDKR